jgi:RND superfamily putative drug exporter
VAVWLVAFIPAVFATAHLPRELKGGGYSRANSPSQRAVALMELRLKGSISRITIVFTSPDLDARGGRFQALEARALARLTPRSVPGLERLDTAASTGSSSLVASDGGAALAVLQFGVPLDQAQQELPLIRSLLAPTALHTAITGEPAVFADIEHVSARDLERAEMYTLPIALIVLFLIFGSVVAAGLPVAGGAVAVTVTLGLVYLLARVMNVSIFVMNVATLIGLAVGIDYSLLTVGRFREELDRGRPVAEAVAVTVERAGRAIFFSGLAVIVGLAALPAVNTLSLRSIGIGGSLVVAVSVAVALTLLPALLGMLGPRVDAGRLTRRARRPGASFWQRWARGVMRHPVSILVATCVIALLIALPALRMSLSVPDASALPSGAESRRGYDVIQAKFNPSTIAPIEALLVWGQAGSGADPFAAANLRRAYEFGRRLRAMSGVAGVTSVVNLPGVDTPAALTAFWRRVARGAGGSPAGVGITQAGASPLGFLGGALAGQELRSARLLASTTTAAGTILFHVSTSAPSSSAAARSLSTDIGALPPPPGMRLYVDGVPAGTRDFLQNLDAAFPWVVVFVVCVTAAVLLVLLRSALLPLKAVAVNTLSLLAAYGALVFVFQWGHLEWLFRFTSTGSVDADLPILMFCGLFGLSMDYEVFLLTRMREVWVATGDNERAVAEGLAATGRIITSAALIVVVVAGSFAFTSVIITKAMGVGLAVAIGLDATLIRILMVPALMKLLGRWNWWLPGWLDKVLPAADR